MVTLIFKELLYPYKMTSINEGKWGMVTLIFKELLYPYKMTSINEGNGEILT